MKSTETITTYYCDACGEKIDAPVEAGESIPSVIKEFRYEVYYAGEQTLKDFCETCNNAILKALVTRMESRIHPKDSG